MMLSEYTGRLRSAREHQRDWRQKVVRLREIVAGVPRGQHLRLHVEEGSTNYILLNLVLKVAALVSNIRLFDVQFRGAPYGVQDWFNKDVKGTAIGEFERVLKDRFAAGMGAVGIGSEERAFIQHIDILDCWWDPEFGYERPSWVIRRIRRRGRVVYEYWDMDLHTFFTEDGVLLEEANGIGVIPVRLIGNIFSVPGVDFPISDTELVYPQQRIINEIRATLLEQARRGAGFFEFQRDAVDPLDIERLREGGEQFIPTETGNAFQAKLNPPPSAEWLNLEALMKSDLDAQSGVSEYLRGSMPVANNIRFATQVLAALGAQNLRIQADWVPVKELLEWLAGVWLRVAKLNGEVWRSGDIFVDLRDVDPEQVTVEMEESSGFNLPVQDASLMGVLPSPGLTGAGG